MHSSESSRRLGQKAIFLDRDGVVNYDAGFVHRRVDFFFLPGVIEALDSIPFEYKKIIISNQSGIGRGFLFHQAQKRFGIEFTSSWIIGDKKSDIAVGRRLKSRTILVNKNRVERNNPQKVGADFRVPGLREAVEVIRSRERRS